MNSTWLPRESAGSSALVYRSQFTSPAPDLREQATEQFASWLRSKGLPATAGSLLDGPPLEATGRDGVRCVAHGAAASYPDRASGRHLLAAAFQLEERQPNGDRWVTSLTTATVVRQDALFPVQAEFRQPMLFDHSRETDLWPERQWAWLDLEHHPGADRHPLRPGSPRIIRDLLARVEGTDASLPLTSELLRITEGHIEELVGWIFEAERRVPVIVFSPDPQNAGEQERFANRLARDVAGVAVVARLADVAAAAAFTRRIGTALHVYGGGMRTYLPGAQPQELFPKRHRVLSAATRRALGGRSANVVRDQVLVLSTRRPPPASYPLVQRALARRSVRRTLGHQRRPLPSRPSTISGTEPLALPLPETVEPATSVPLDWAGHQANQVVRASLVLGGLDPGGIPVSAPESTAAQVAAERQALQELLLDAVRREAPPPPDSENSDLAVRLAEAEEENAVLYTEIEILEARLSAGQDALTALEQLRYDHEFAQLELTDAERSADHLRARVRWLESELAAKGAHLIGVALPPEQLPEAPDSITGVLELAADRFSRLVLGDTAEAAARLDVYPQAERWAIKIWQALEALDTYAAARFKGDWSNSFLAWCQEPLPGHAAVPATWVALKESETTDTNPKLRKARTFAVPAELAASRQLYMPAHVKITQGGVPSPRLHFHDDSGGTTGRVYVGYVGDHLPTASFS